MFVLFYLSKEELAPTHGQDYTRLRVPEMELLRANLEAADQRWILGIQIWMGIPVLNVCLSEEVKSESLLRKLHNVFYA